MSEKPCDHSGDWETWPEVITEAVLKSGKYGTRCVDCGQNLTLEQMLVRMTTELR